MPAASTIKVPILVAVLRRVARGELRAGDSIRLATTRVGGSGPLAALASVTQLQVGELLELMITLSDNDATNALLDLVGLSVVDRLCPELGMARTCVRRRLMDQDAAAGGPGQHHLRGRPGAGPGAAAARRAARRRRRPVLRSASWRPSSSSTGLPALLPTGVWHGNKSGELTGVRHDMMLLEMGGRGGRPWR